MQRLSAALQVSAETDDAQALNNNDAAISRPTTMTPEEEEEEEGEEKEEEEPLFLRRTHLPPPKVEDDDEDGINAIERDSERDSESEIRDQPAFVECLTWTNQKFQLRRSD